MTYAVSFGLIGRDTIEGAKTLLGFVEEDNYTTLEIPKGTPYRVPAEENFYFGIVITMAEKAVGGVILGYGDDVVVNSVTPPTNYHELTFKLPHTVANGRCENKIIMFFPAGKYPCINGVLDDVEVYIIGYNELI